MIYVAVSSFNSIRTMSQTLDSLLVQDFTAWQAHIIDGGSTDGTLEILSDYAMRDSRFSIEISKGRSSWRQSAIKHLKSFDKGFFMWLDPDDFLDQNYLRICRNNLIESNTYGCIGNIVHVSPQGVFEKNHIANYYSFDFIGNQNSNFRLISNFALPNSFGASNLIYSLWRREMAKSFLNILINSVDGTDFDRRIVMNALRQGCISQVNEVSIYRRLKSSPLTLDLKVPLKKTPANPFLCFFREDFRNSSFKTTIIQHLSEYNLQCRISFVLIHSVRFLLIVFYRITDRLRPREIVNSIRRK